MPNYTIKNKHTLKTKDVSLTFEELKEYIKDNPDWYQVITPKGFIPSKFSNIPLDNNLKGIYDNIKRNHPGNTIDKLT